MTLYADLIDRENFPDRVAKIREHLRGLPSGSLDAVEQNDPGLLDRLELLLDRVLVLTAITTPEVVPTGRPAQLATLLSDIDTSLGYLADATQAPTTWGQIPGPVHSLSNELWTWQAWVSGDDWREAVTDAASTYRRSVGQQLSAVNADLADLSTQVLGSKRELDELATKASNLEVSMGEGLEDLRERSQERLAALETQIEAMSTQITAAVARQDTAIQQYQEQFSTAQDKRGTDFTEMLQGARTALLQTRAELNESAGAAQTELEAQVEKAKALLSVFAGAGTASAYGKEAKEQGDAANQWRWIAVTLAVLGAAAAGILLLALGTKDASTSEIIGKLAVTVVIAGAASYAATQSSAHRKREVANRRSELLLVSFEPFVRDLPETDRDKARVDLLQTLMADGGAGGTTGSSDEPVISAGQMNLFKQFFDMIVKR